MSRPSGWVIPPPGTTGNGGSGCTNIGYLTAWSKRYPSKKALDLGTAAAVQPEKVGSEFGTLEDFETYLKEAIVLGNLD